MVFKPVIWWIYVKTLSVLLNLEIYEIFIVLGPFNQICTRGKMLEHVM